MTDIWTVSLGIDWTKVWKTWTDGGWIMLPLAVIGLLTYAYAFQVLRALWPQYGRNVSDRELRRWVADPNSAPKDMGDAIRYAQDDVDSVEEIQLRFAEIVGSRIPEIDRRIQWIQKLVASAPLLGLLGTVLGMLTTFEGIAVGGGRMVDSIARGISEALITTEMGLLIALPGLVLVCWIHRKRQDLVALLARLESLTVQNHRKNPDPDNTQPLEPAPLSNPHRPASTSSYPSRLKPARA